MYPSVAMRVACLNIAMMTCVPSLALAQRATATHVDIARSWAPVVMQDTDNDDVQDFITRWDYDDDDPRNNWESLYDYRARLKAHVYYSVIEATEHYYVSYFFYHPRDWQIAATAHESPCAHHEHDFEGITFVIRRPAKADSDLLFMYAQAHDDTYYFTNQASIGIEDIADETALHCWPGRSKDHLDHLYGHERCPQSEDRRICFRRDDASGLNRPVVFVEAGGHGVGQPRRAMEAAASGIELDCGTFRFRGGDGVVYMPSPTNTAELPASSADSAVQAEYALLPLEDEIWRHRHGRGAADLFNGHQRLRTGRAVTLSPWGMGFNTPDACTARAPWAWDEHSSSDCHPRVCSPNVVIGDWFLDPANFAKAHLTGIPDLEADDYVSNVYLADRNQVRFAVPSGEDRGLFLQPPGSWTLGQPATITWAQRPVAPPETGLGSTVDLVLLDLAGRIVQWLAPEVRIRDGSWTWPNVDGVIPGQYRLRATAYSAAGRWLTMSATSDEFAIIGGPEGGIIEGYVTLAGQLMHAGTRITLLRYGLPSAVTGADGYYRLSGLPTGLTGQVLAITRPGYEHEIMREIPITTTPTRADATLRPLEPDVHSVTDLVAIPDNTPTGVISTLTVVDDFTLCWLEVDVVISHSYPQDLTVDLLHGSRSVRLWEHGPNAIKLIGSFPSTLPAHGDLTVFSGESVRGAWHLKIADTAEEDAGTIVLWGLRLRRAPALEIRNAIAPAWLQGYRLRADAELLSTGGVPVRGVAADGIAQLLLRVPTPVPGAVRVALSDPEGRWDDLGTLHALGASPGGLIAIDTHTVTTARGPVAYAVYTAPDDFVRSSADRNRRLRDIPLTIEFQPDTAPPGVGSCSVQSKIEVHRPPVVFCHGLWGRSDTWQFSPVIRDPGQRWRVYFVDYRDSHGYALAYNAPKLRTAIQSAKRDLVNRDSIVAAQVDFVGHSMGGLLGRVHASTGPGLYERVDNLGAGDFHKYLSLNSPHHGSPFANCLRGMRDAMRDPRTPRETALDYASFFVLLKAFQQTTDAQVIGGALDDLSEGSDALRALGPFSVKSHVHVGTGGTDPTSRNAQPWWLLTQLMNRLYGCGPWGSGTEHDFIVSRPSQQAGLNVLAHRTVTRGVDGIHSRASKSNTVGQVVELWAQARLDDPMLASGLPAPAAFLGPSVASGPAVRAVRWTEGAVRITSPSEGAIVRPGEAVAVAVSTAGVEGVDQVLVLAGGESVFFDAPPYNGALLVPAGLAGSVPIHAFAITDSLAILEAPPVRVKVEPIGTVEAVSLLPATATLNNLGETLQLTVLAQYSDGVVRDVTTGSAGTRYVSYNTAVASVTAHGLVQAVGSGMAEIEVLVGNRFEATLTVISAGLAAVNNPPVADAGGPYFGCRDGTVCLNAYGSYDPDSTLGDVLSYEWDLDGDGMYDDAAVADPCDSVRGSRVVFLRVTDSRGAVSTDFAIIIQGDPPDCPVTPIVLQDLTAGLVDGAVMLTWRVSSQPHGDLRRIDVYRAQAAEGPYQRRTNMALPPTTTSFVDTDVRFATTYWYQLHLEGTDGTVSLAGPVVITTPQGTTSLRVAGTGSTVEPLPIRFSLAEAVTVRLAVYDIAGRELRRVLRGTRDAGLHTATWDYRNESGKLVARGVYLIELRAGTKRIARKHVLVD